MLQIEGLHHVSVPVRDVERSDRFYREVLGLEPLQRPDFKFKGKWYRVGDRDLHLIEDPKTVPTFREGKSIDSHDVHFAIRVRDYEQALEHLRAKGYSEDAADDLMKMKVNRDAKAGFPQIYILDPDRNVIEINAQRSD